MIRKYLLLLLRALILISVIFLGAVWTPSASNIPPQANAGMVQR